MTPHHNYYHHRCRRVYTLSAVELSKAKNRLHLFTKHSSADCLRTSASSAAASSVQLNNMPQISLKMTFEIK